MTEGSIPISLVADSVFCRRRAWYAEQGVRPEGGDTEHGMREHARQPLPLGAQREVPVRSAELGVHGRIDQVRRAPDGGVELVETKTSPRRAVPHVSDSMLVQLALYRACAIEEGLDPVTATVSFPEAFREIPVPSEDLDQFDLPELVRAARSVIRSASPPPRLHDDDPRCRGCSVVSACRPDSEPAHRIVPRNSSARVLYLTDPGTYTHIRDGRIRVRRRGTQIKSIPADTVSGISVFGNADLSTGVINHALWNGIPITFSSAGGRFCGSLTGARPMNGSARFELARMNEDRKLSLVRPVIAAKIHNQAAVLSRYRQLRPVAEAIRGKVSEAENCRSSRELLGVEGDAARMYFEAWPDTLKSAALRSRWSGRVGRGANDPVNIVLNLAYGVLLSEMVRSIAALGLDPGFGLLHSPARNKPALALDLMEQFRAPLSDRVVKRLINRGSITTADFDDVHGRVTLRREAARKVYIEFGDSLAQTHRFVADYPELTWRRTIEYQVRELVRCIEDRDSAYRAVRVR